MHLGYILTKDGAEATEIVAASRTEQEWSPHNHIAFSPNGTVATNHVIYSHNGAGWQRRVPPPEYWIP